MANERLRQQMQEALDAALSAEEFQALRTELDADMRSTAEFNRLKKVDKLLKEAPFERAPERLALNIIAKLAEAMKPENMTREASLALALGLALVMLVALPLLVAALGLFLAAMGSAAALNAVLAQIVNLLAMVMAMLDAFVQSARDAMSDTQAPAMLLALIPITTYWILRFAQDQYGDNDKEQL
jgi:anti-sigma factor RsiW